MNIIEDYFSVAERQIDDGWVKVKDDLHFDSRYKILNFLEKNKGNRMMGRKFDDKTINEIIKVCENNNNSLNGDQIFKIWENQNLIKKEIDCNCATEFGKVLGITEDNDYLVVDIK